MLHGWSQEIQGAIRIYAMSYQSVDTIRITVFVSYFMVMLLSSQMTFSVNTMFVLQVSLRAEYTEWSKKSGTPVLILR